MSNEKAALRTVSRRLEVGCFLVFFLTNVMPHALRTLIVASALCSALVQVDFVLGQSSTRENSFGSKNSVSLPIRKALSRTASIRWQQVPLREALTRLGTTFELVWFLDRRIDPQKRVSFLAKQQTLAAMLDQLAVQNDLAVWPIGSVLYVGPLEESADFLEWQENEKNINAHNASRVKGLKPSLRLRKALAKKGTAEWPTLSEPRELLTQQLKQARIGVEGIERVPHDVWPAGQLPNLPLSDRLDLLLVGFDLDWQFTPSGKKIQIVPREFQQGETVQGGEPQGGKAKQRGQGSDARQKLADLISNQTKPRQTNRPNDQRYTLRVQDKPLDGVLRQIAKSVNLTLQINPTAQAAAKANVSVSVNQVTVEELVNALAKDADLEAVIEAEKIIVRVRQ